MSERPPSRRRPKPRAEIRVDRALLRRWPMPVIASDASKEDRGAVLIVGGSDEMPGAVILAGLAALRAGAGKLAIATAASVVPVVAGAVPEARVVALFGPSRDDKKSLAKLCARSRAIVLGPGIRDRAQALKALAAMSVPHSARLVIDAEALVALADDPSLVHSTKGRVVLTPHAGEMAGLLGRSRSYVETHAARLTLDASKRFGAVIALKGEHTFVAAPDGQLWRSDAGNPGLATSGSGDVLAGLAGGLLARGASVAQAAVWATHIHALAGEALARRIAPLGYLARELLDELPRLLSR